MIQHEGPGWRLQRDTSRSKFTFLLGGDNWAVEFSLEEWNVLCRALFQLMDQHEQIKSQLMKEEKIHLEIEITPCWACIEGTRDCWDLHLILSSEGIYQDRGVELYWPVPAAQAMTKAIRTMWDS